MIVDRSCARRALPRRAFAAALLVADPIGIAAAESSAESDRFPGIQAGATYVGDIWRNVHGGLRTGWKFLGNLDLSLEIDAEEAWNIPGATFFANALLIHGGSLSERLLGDAQTASNIEAPSQTRLFELWFEQRFGSESTHSLRAGLYDLNSEFDASEVSSLFVHSSHGIGPQISQTGLNGPSIFPVTALGMRVNAAIDSQWTTRLVILDGVPGDPDSPSSNQIRLDSDEGALVVAELSFGGERLKQATLGAWGYTARFDRIDADPEAPAAPSRGNRGAYVLVEGNLFTEAQDEQRGLDGFVRAGTANGRLNQFDRYVGFGVVYTGLLRHRPEDQLGLALASVYNGTPYLRASREAGIEPDDAEHAIEMSYRFAVTDWLTLQGVVQHIMDPGTDPELKDATALALRFELSKGFFE